MRALKGIIGLAVLFAVCGLAMGLLSSDPSPTVPDPGIRPYIDQSTEASVPAQKPKVTARPATDNAVYYGSCKAMRADHPNGVRRGHPAYRSGLDRDDDGRACEL